MIECLKTKRFTNSISPSHVFLFIHYKPLKRTIGHFFSRNRNAFSIFESNRTVYYFIDRYYISIFLYVYLSFFLFLSSCTLVNTPLKRSILSSRKRGRKLDSYLWTLSNFSFNESGIRIPIITRESHVGHRSITIFNTSRF